MGSSKKEKRDEDKKERRRFLGLLLSFLSSGVLGDHFFFIKELTILMVLSICACSSLDFPSFIISRIRDISSPEKLMPFLFAFVIRAIMMGARSRPDLPAVWEAAI